MEIYRSQYNVFGYRPHHGIYPVYESYIIDRFHFVRFRLIFFNHQERRT